MAKIQVRRDTAANWTAVNPILSNGEIGYESDTGKFKIGNGSATWNNRPYFSSTVVIPTASDTVLGGIKIGAGLGIDGNGTATAAYGRAGSGGVYLLNVDNFATGSYAGALAGLLNNASGSMSIIGGGTMNVASNNYCCVVGGNRNWVNGLNSAIVAGYDNFIAYHNFNTDYCFIAHGTQNRALNKYCFMGNGDLNKAFGDFSTIVNGTKNRAVGRWASIFNGQTNKAVGLSSVIGNGSNNTTTGIRSSVLAGDKNIATGELSCVVGGKQASADLYAEHAHAAGGFKAAGEAQTRRFVLRAEINGAVSDLTLDGNARALFIPLNASWNYSIKVIGRSLVNYHTAAFNFVGVTEYTDLGSSIIADSKTALIKDRSAWDVNCSVKTKSVARIDLPTVKLGHAGQSTFDFDINGDYELIESGVDDVGRARELWTNGRFWLQLFEPDPGAVFIYGGVLFDKPANMLTFWPNDYDPNVLTNLSGARADSNGVPGPIINAMLSTTLQFEWQPGRFENNHPDYVRGLQLYGQNKSTFVDLPYLAISCDSGADNVRWVANVEALQVINPSTVVDDYGYSDYPA